MSGNSEVVKAGLVIWITGAPYSGKTSVGAKVCDDIRVSWHCEPIHLDGDLLRLAVGASDAEVDVERRDLGRVYVRLAKILSRQGHVVVVSAVAMYEEVFSELLAEPKCKVWAFRLDVDANTRMERSGFMAPKKARLPELSTAEVPGWVSVIANGGDATPESTASEIVASVSVEESPSISDERQESAPLSVESEILSFGRAHSIRNHYWSRTYEKDEGITEPSSFALWLVQRLGGSGVKNCLDFGCGNGRDAAHLSKIVNVVGVDAAESAVTLAKRLWAPLSANNTLEFVRGTDDDLNRLLTHHEIDFFYSRFVWHSLTPSQEIGVLSALKESLSTGGIVALEARTTEDPMASRGTKISRNERALGHYRRFLQVDELLDRMEDAGLLIKEIVQGRGLAALGDDDPHVVRLLAQKR